MTIDSTTTFNAVMILCRCETGEFAGIAVQQGQDEYFGPGSNSVKKVPHPPVDTNPEVAEVLRRIRAGTAKAFYVDGSSYPWTAVNVEEAPQPFWQFHSRHPFWRDDGYKMLDRIATQADLQEGDNTRDFVFNGGLVPSRIAAQGATLDHPLSNWAVSRISDSQLSFRLVIPASKNMAPAGLATYADSAAFIAWLDSYRTTGDAIPRAFATTAGAFSGRRWKFPVDPDNPTDRFATFAFSGLTLGQIPGQNTLITLTITLNIVEVDAGRTKSEVLTHQVGEVVAAATGTIPTAGQKVEPAFGSNDVPVTASGLSSRDGRMTLAGGMALMHWTDPGENIPRQRPLSGFGRSIDYTDLASRSQGGRWMPRPEERPAVDAVHFHGNGPASLWFESADKFVGYTGTDRVIVIHNRGTGTLSVGVQTDATTAKTLLSLQSNERMQVRAGLSLNGESEFLVESAPKRWMVRTASFVNVTSPDYRWTTGGVEFGFRPWLAISNTARRDNDEFTFGPDVSHSSGDLLTDGFSNSVHVVTTAHNGEFAFYENVEAELRGSGLLLNGHYSTLVRQRGDTLAVFGRHWQPNLSGIGQHRSYETLHIDQCQAGDKYMAGIMYIVSGTTINFNTLRINSLTQLMRVEPRIQI